MKLEGKAKEDFEKWYSKLTGDYPNWRELYKLPESMQYGVYVDWFDSVGINILITVEFDFGYIIVEKRYDEIEEVKRWYNTRPEARTKAIEKAVEIYNK